MEEWKGGGMEEWRSGRLEVWKISPMKRGYPMPQQTSTKLQPSGLRSLRAYQLAKQLAHLIYEMTTNFPKNEFRLVGQMREAAVSVFGNIAEGYGRNSIGDYIRFCEIARGSLAEVGSYLEFCQQRKFFKPADEQPLLDLYNHTWNTLGALISSLQEARWFLESHAQRRTGTL